MASALRGVSVVAWRGVVTLGGANRDWRLRVVNMFLLSERSGSEGIGQMTLPKVHLTYTLGARYRRHCRYASNGAPSREEHHIVRMT